MKPIAMLVAIAALLACSILTADEGPQLPGPQKEHEWLQQFVGEWKSESEAKMAPGESAVKCRGTMKTRSLGGFWVVSELQTDVMGTTMHGVQTIGYDPTSQKYVGTWVDSVLSHLWKYEGSIDEAGKKLTLEATGPNFVSPGKTAKFRDAYEFQSKDHILVTSSMQGEDGEWVTFMTGSMTRKK